MRPAKPVSQSRRHKAGNVGFITGSIAGAAAGHSRKGVYAKAVGGGVVGNVAAKGAYRAGSYPGRKIMANSKNAKTGIRTAKPQPVKTMGRVRRKSV